MPAALDSAPAPIPAPTLDLSIIIVSWNVWDLLRACLQALEGVSRSLGAPGDIRGFGPAAAQATLEVIVVDNASSDATVTLLPARFPWVRLIRSATNLGFTGGNNLGYAACRGRTVYFLNPDTELVGTPVASSTSASTGAPTGAPTATPTQTDSLWTLYRAVADEPDVGLAGPQLRYADNTLQSSRRRFPTRWTLFMESTWLGKLWPRNPWARRLTLADWPGDFRQEVDWVVGAAMLARRSALEAVRAPGAVGPFDEGYFMYSEELDLCHRLKRAGWRVIYVPEARVVHYEGRSSDQAVAARHIHFNRSKIRYATLYFGPRWAAWLRRFLLWEFRMQLWIERAKWLLGHKRPLRAQRIAVYREVLATGLR
jgi:GT2 family glycosyltransferase